MQMAVGIHLKQTTRLFSPEDYLSCEDKKVVEVYKRLTGKNSDDKTVDISNYHLTEDGFLMHLDRVTNMMATVIPTKSVPQAHTRHRRIPEFRNECRPQSGGD